MKKINVITLGCSKNTVDSEHLAAQLADAGYEIVFDSDRTRSDVVVINTCGFIGDAKKESIDTILAAAAAKQQGLVGELFVIGCLSERYADELRAELPEVDDFFGVKNWEQIVERLGARHRRELETRRMLSTPSHYAYLKIAEGCDRMCGYCAIPLIRGRYVSRPLEELVEEATALAESGVRELIVIAQDTTCYGIDLYGRRALAELLERLCRIDKIRRIRLHYAYPTDFTDELIDTMAREKKICRYIDLPFQHISDSQLAAMKRNHTSAEAYALVDRLRERIPGIALRTTLMVGYPGESEADFEELMQPRALRASGRLRLLRGGGHLLGPAPERRRARRCQAGAPRPHHAFAGAHIARKQRRPHRSYNARDDRFARGRLLHRTHRVRLARGRRRSARPGRRPSPAPRLHIRRAHNRRRGLRSVRKRNRIRSIDYSILTDELFCRLAENYYLWAE